MEEENALRTVHHSAGRGRERILKSGRVEIRVGSDILSIDKDQ
jgi:hypothetical protein